MSKKKLKSKKIKELKGKDGITGLPLSQEVLDDLSLIDPHRIVSKKDNGTYANDNYTVTDPVVHMKIHGNHRERPEEIQTLKSIIDARKPILKTSLACGNRIRAFKRHTDHLDPQTVEWLESVIELASGEVKKREIEIVKQLKKINHPFVNAALGIKGVGPIAVAYMLVYIDITKARYASSLWKYVGYDKPSYERYTKGEKSGGNKNLRTALYVLASSFIRLKSRGSVYGEIYEAEKAKLSASEKYTMSRKTDGKAPVKMMWKDTMPQHRHDAAIRKMLKHFLADSWKVWRTIEGLPTPYLYVQEKLGHTGIVQPEERGWVYKRREDIDEEPAPVEI